jgi:hypothetical protein
LLEVFEALPPTIAEMEDSLSLNCAENIALLHLLHAGRKDGAISKDSVPVRPSIAPVDSSKPHREEYDLSFVRERSLAGALAYLSNINGDTDRIPAICIEENHRPPGKPSLGILVAVNKSGFQSGDALLYKIKSGFEGIFATLAKIMDDSKFFCTPGYLKSAAEFRPIQ